MRIKPKSPREALQPEPAPAPPQRSRHVRNPLVILINMVITLAVFGLAAVGAALYIGKQKFEEAGPLKEPATVVISSGAGLSGITDRLAGKGVISDTMFDEWIFNLGIRFYKNATA